MASGLERRGAILLRTALVCRRRAARCREAEELRRRNEDKSPNETWSIPPAYLRYVDDVLRTTQHFPQCGERQAGQGIFVADASSFYPTVPSSGQTRQRHEERVNEGDSQDDDGLDSSSEDSSSELGHDDARETNVFGQEDWDKID